MRTNVYSGLLDVLSHNKKQKNKDSAFFEIAHVFSNQEGLSSENENIAFAYATEEKKDFYAFKNKIEKIINQITNTTISAQTENISDYAGALKYYINEECIGFCGLLREEKTALYDLENVFVAEFDCEKLFALKKEKKLEKLFSRLYPV